MRYIKLLLISFVVFFGLLTAMSLFIPSQVRISKAINIGPQNDSVFRWIRNKDQWPEWHPAFQQANQGAGGNRTEVPAISLVSQTDSLLVLDVSSRPGKTVRNSWEIHRFGASDSLTLQWYMDFRLSWLPWHKFGSLFYEGTYGKIMQQGLENLKALEEGKLN